MTTVASDLPFTDLGDPAMISHPFARYAELRRTAPVSLADHEQGTRMSKGFMLTKYHDVFTLHSDSRFSSDPAHTAMGKYLRFLPPTLRMLNESMVMKDDPEHRRLRALVSAAFTPRYVREMADAVDRIVTESVETLVGRDQVDLVADFAVPVPLAVIAEMLGVSDADRQDFHVWVSTWSEATAAGNPVALLRGLPSARKITKLLGRLVDDARANPDDGLVSALVQASEDGDSLSAREVTGMLFLLLLAGHDTTSNLLGSSVLALIDHPDQLQRLRDEPELINSAVEELLRFTAPVPCGVIRTALEDLEIAGVAIPRGSSVIGMIISANRDEDVFDDPEILDIAREPNRHMAFAVGVHYCLGNQLARMEARAALSALVERFDHIELAIPRDAVQWRTTQPLRGLQSLPLRLR
ncbi:MAG: putative cytochrome hydroxylase [Aeromicrobium sp.]|nr:putative cytochrome hydroxylase [Aeromicrobium sp.]